MINFKTIIRIIGILLLLETVMFLCCSGVSYYYGEGDLTAFWKAGAITAGAGLLFAALGREGEHQLTRRDGYVLVSFLLFFNKLRKIGKNHIAELVNH